MAETVLAPEFTRFNDSLGVPMWCVFGYNVSTPYVVYYDTDWTTPVKMDVGEGDGTVPIDGLVRQCRRWNATMVPVINMSHDNGIRNSDALSVLWHVLGV